MEIALKSDDTAQPCGPLVLLGNIQLLYGFRVWMFRELRKARETRAEGE